MVQTGYCVYDAFVITITKYNTMQIIHTGMSKVFACFKHILLNNLKTNLL